MRPSQLILHAAAFLVLACPLPAARITRTYALENRSEAPWRVQAPTRTPAAAGGAIADSAEGGERNEPIEPIEPIERVEIVESAEFQVTDAGPGPNAWTEAPGPAPGFSGQLQARSTLTLTVTFEASTAPPVLQLFPPGSTQEPVLLDLAGPRSGPDTGDGLDGRFILPLDEAPSEPEEAPATSPAPRSSPSGPGDPSRPSPPAAPDPEAGAALAFGPGPLLPATSSQPGTPGPAEDAPAPFLQATASIQEYCAKDLVATLATGFPVPALAALAGPLGELADCRKAFGIQWAAMNKLLARAAAPTALPIPAYLKTLKVILVLLEGCEEKARETFVRQADCIMVRMQPSILKALGATQRRLVKLPASHTREAAEALATDYRLLSVQWKATQCLALEWAAVATTAPWSAWREVVHLPRRTAALDLHMGWTGAPAPFLAPLGQDPEQIHFITSDQRIRNMAQACGLDAGRLTTFDLETWMRVLDKRRADEDIRVKALEAQRVMAGSARDREQAERAQAHQAREAAQKATRLAMQQSAQQAQRQAAARAREQHKRELEARAAAKRQEAEATRARIERETRIAQDQARAAEAARSSREAREREAVRSRAEARDALRTRREVAKARRDTERKRAFEAEAQRTADSQRATQAEAQRAADSQRATQAEAQRAADSQRATQAEAQRAADSQRATQAEAQRAADSKRTAEAETQRAAGTEPKRPDEPFAPFAPFAQEALAFQHRLDRELRIRRLLLIPSHAPMAPDTAIRVRTALQRYRLRNAPALPPAELPPAPAFSTRLIQPLRGPLPAPSPGTVQRYATSPYPGPASAE
jgi:hypothetical protein